MSAGRASAWRAAGQRVISSVLISLAAGLALLAHAPQGALAASWQQPTLISAGAGYACTIESGKAYCWGDNTEGELGDGNTADTSAPVAVDTSGALAGKTLTQITGASETTCALDSVGRAYCWGYNGNGELGTGITADPQSDVPLAVVTSGALAGKTLTQISTGEFETCALDSAGHAYCWGTTSGDGDSNPHAPLPAAVDTSGVLAGKTLTQVSAGAEGACTLDTAGRAYCWSYNGYNGTLGNGSTANSNTPVAVDTSGVLAGKTLIQVSDGDNEACALDSAGAAYCWGSNFFGQLGDGKRVDSRVPVAVNPNGAGAFTHLIAGWSSTCATDRTGAVYCWGDNLSGELGDGGTDNAAVPVAVNAGGVLRGKMIVQLATGQASACAMDSARVRYCWGSNSTGQLGDGSNGGQSNLPRRVGPQAPANVIGVPGDTAVTVSWTPPTFLNTGTLTGYTATAAPDGATCATTTATTCTISGLANGIAYSVTVAAHTTIGDSGASTPGIATPEPPGATGPIISGYRHAKCIDDHNNSAANDTPVVIGDCNGSPEQNWTTEGNGTIQIHGKCLDIYREKKTSKTSVELWTCTGHANQQWQARNGTLANPDSGKCLDDPRFNITTGTQLEIYTCNGGANQQWKLP